MVTMHLYRPQEGGILTIPLPYHGGLDAGVVWHYTSGEALIGIVKSSQVRASMPLVLNDSSEVEHGVRVVRDRWNNVRTVAGEALRQYLDGFLLDVDDAKAAVAAHTFVISASREGDALSQWRAYGGEAGYALGFLDSAGMLRPAVDEEPRPNIVNVASGGIGWYRVLYDRAEQESAVDGLLRFILKYSSDVVVPYQIRALYTIILCLKDAGFMEEQEVRYLVSREHSSQTDNFRASKYGIVPYLNVVAEAPDNAGKLPLAAVAVGPNPYKDLAKLGLHRLLQVYGYDSTDVVSSEIPYRA